LYSAHRLKIVTSIVENIKLPKNHDANAMYKQNCSRILSALITMLIHEDGIRVRLGRGPKSSKKHYGKCSINEERHGLGLAIDLLPMLNSMEYALERMKLYFDIIIPNGNLIHVEMFEMGIGPVY